MPHADGLFEAEDVRTFRFHADVRLLIHSLVAVQLYYSLKRSAVHDFGIFCGGRRAWFQRQKQQVKPWEKAACLNRVTSGCFKWEHSAGLLRASEILVGRQNASG